MGDTAQRGASGGSATTHSVWKRTLDKVRRTTTATGKTGGSRKKAILYSAIILVVVAAGTTWWLVAQHSNDSKVAAGPVAAEYKKRLPELEKAAKDNPNDPAAHKNYAVALYATGTLDKSRDEYEKAVKLNDKDAIAYNNLGNVYRDMGNTQKAAEAYKKSIDLNKTSINTYVNLANLQLYTQKDGDAAITTYKEGLKHLPENEQLQLLLGIAYEQTDQTDNAKKTYEAILAKHSDNAAAKANLARLNNK